VYCVVGQCALNLVAYDTEVSTSIDFVFMLTRMRVSPYYRIIIHPVERGGGVYSRIFFSLIGCSCCRTFLMNLFLVFSGVTYGRFIVVRFVFNLLAPELFF